MYVYNNIYIYVCVCVYACVCMYRANIYPSIYLSTYLPIYLSTLKVYVIDSVLCSHSLDSLPTMTRNTAPS